MNTYLAYSYLTMASSTLSEWQIHTGQQETEEIIEIDKCVSEMTKDIVL